MSYLNTPRLSFAGKFQADPSTVNNDPAHFNNDVFQSSYQEYGEGGSNGWWNPNGTGNFRLVDCVVTSVTYKDGTTTSENSVDSIIGMSIMDANTRTAGKMVDLDPQQQTVSMIWGMTVRLVAQGGIDLFSGDFKPVAFNNIWWSKCNPPVHSSQGASATYQSVIKNVHWNNSDIAPSKYLKELQEDSADQLSIQFNVDLHDNQMYMPDGTSLNPNFTLGRLVGSIGPSYINEPDHFVIGRQFYPSLIAQSGMYLPKENIYFATAIVENDKFILDLGNSLQIYPPPSLSSPAITQPEAGTLNETRELFLGYQSGEARFMYFSLGEINCTETDWYTNTGGLVTLKLNSEQLKIVNENQLFIVTNASGSSMQPVLTEKTDVVRADSFVYRLDPGDTTSLEVYASKLGNPLPDTKINLQQLNVLINIQGQQFSEINSGKPEEALTFKQSALTDKSGKAVFNLHAHDPKNPRSFIDGQIYALWCSIEGEIVPEFTYSPPTSNPAISPSHLDGINPNDFVSVLVHDFHNVSTSPAWGDVSPVLQQYANLYPIMSNGVFNLADQTQVSKNAKLLKFVFSLPIEDPNHMPATRDLSRDKRTMILNYLDEIISEIK